MTPKGSIFERIDCRKDHEHVIKGARKCPSTWWARVRYVDPETGKTKDLQRRADSRTDAIDKRDSLISDIKKTAGRSVGSERMTIAELCDYYERHYVKEAEYVDDRKVAGLRSWYTVKKQLDMLKDYFGDRALRSLTYGAIRQFRTVRFKVPTKANGQRSIASVNRELALLRRMLNVATAEGWLIASPFNQGAALISNADEKKRERIITQAEENALLAACNAPKRAHLRAIIIAALDTGCRRGELLKLRWEDVDLTTGQIEIIAFNTKTAKPRAVAMTTRLRGELERLRSEAHANDPRARVFGGLQSVKKSFTGARNDAGLPDLRFHDLRHSAASRLVQAHIPLSEVGRVLGHSQPSTTYRYVNANVETAQRAATALDNFNSLVTPDPQTTISETIN
jgi:integrase